MLSENQGPRRDFRLSICSVFWLALRPIRPWKSDGVAKSPQPLASPALTRLHGPRQPNCGLAMLELLGFISYLITLYTYIVIAVVIVSWLMAFGVINAYNPTVRTIWQALNALTEPLLGPIRNAMPNMGGLDISPVILLLACYFVQSVVLPNIAKAII
jgi:YggT family protein